MGEFSSRANRVVSRRETMLVSFLLLFIVGCGGQEDGTEENPTKPDAPTAENAAAPAEPQFDIAALAKKIPDMPSVQEPTAESLKAVVTSCLKSRNADDPETRVAAIKAMLIRPEDLPVIFPELSDSQIELASRLFALFRSSVVSSARHIELNVLRSRQARFAESVEVSDPVSLRDLGDDETLQELSDRFPADLPIYHVDLRGLGRISELFFFVNGRWVWTDEFDEAVEMFLEGKFTEEDVEEAERHTQKQLERYPEPAEQSAGEETIGDLHYGLLVYSGELDRHVRLGPRARYIRAVYRRAGQGNYASSSDLENSDVEDPLGAFVGRVRRFGRDLRDSMSDQERNQLEGLVEEGYFYGIEATEDSVAWRSKKGLEGVVWRRSGPPTPSAEELVLPLSHAATLLEIRDRAIRTAVLQQLAVLPLDAQVQPGICEALLALIKDPDLRQTVHKRHAFLCYVRWVSQDNCDSLERLMSERDVKMYWVPIAFARLAELDRGRAVEYIGQRAPHGVIVFWTMPQSFDTVWRGGKPVWNTPFVKIDSEGAYVRDDSDTDGGGGAADPRSVMLHKLFVRALLQSGNESKLKMAGHAIEQHHPELKEEAAPYLGEQPGK